MTIAPGTHLGPYEILRPIGAGGMGEVYCARDSRLGREVAIKVLPAEMAGNASRLRRFEQEARAAGALNHPNILVIYDVGDRETLPYLVTELLEGETLRDRLASGAISPRQAIGYALQIAKGLTAAHEKGIVHRDLKPENLFVTHDGLVKILDFGLAKLAPPVLDADSPDRTGPTAIHVTEPGSVLGTVGYMSPEQVRGKPADARSDLFSFGAVWYEMLSGRRAFWRESSVGTMNAILEDEPDGLQAFRDTIGPALVRVVLHCLEKGPERRFQTASDLLFALETLAEGSGVLADPARPAAASTLSKPGRRLGLALAGGILLAALLGGVYLAGQHAGGRTLPVYRQLTFRRGVLQAARFAADGQSVVFGAAWEGGPIQLFTTRPASPGSRPLQAFVDTGLLAISATGELAICRNARFLGGPFVRGLLARVDFSADAPRDLVEEVEWADWSPNGERLAIVREVDDRDRLEFPIGKVLYETYGRISHPRVAPGGELIAFFDHPSREGDRGALAVVDLAGRKRTLSEGWLSVSGLAWAPAGREVWFTATKSGMSSDLHAVTLSGGQRLIERVAGRLTLHDISREGRALITRDAVRLEILGLPPGETKERHLSWFDAPTARDLSPDGKTLLFDERGDGGGEEFAVFVRSTYGSDAIRLGRGAAMGLSPDGGWALSIDYRRLPPQLVLLATGAGDDRPLPRHSIVSYQYAAWFPDGRRILFAGNEQDRGTRLYIQDLDGNRSGPLTPEGVAAATISPGGDRIAILDLQARVSLLSLDDGVIRPIPGLVGDEVPLRWSADGRSLYVRRPGELPATVEAVDVATGRRTPWKQFLPSDPAGVIRIFAIHMTPDLKVYVYTYERIQSDLYVVDGLK
jgi:Tol biopolymer transport system component